MLLVGAGSFIGGALRYLVSTVLHPVGRFPISTFVVNVIGCLLIGLLYGLFSKYSTTSSHYCLLLTTGLCGGFTTFSTFANESLLMLQSSDYLMFTLYISLSVVMGIIAVMLGYSLTRIIC